MGKSVILQSRIIRSRHKIFAASVAVADLRKAGREKHTKERRFPDFLIFPVAVAG